MSEGTHSTPTQTPFAGKRPSQRKQRIILFLAGTAAAVLIAAVAFQIFRAEEAVTGEERGGNQSAAGKVNLNDQRGQALARVNGEYINYEQVARECFDRYGKDMLENLINRTIIQQACAERGIEITRAEVDAEIVKIAKRLNLDVQAWYEFLQVERGVTPAEVRRDRIWPMVALKKLAGETIEVTGQDMQEGYIRYYGPRVEGRMIVLGNMRHAQEIWEQARKSPEDFPRLAQEHSIDRSSAPLGGVIPPIHRHGPNKKLEDEAFRLKDDEISAIVEIGVGQYAIFKREGMTNPNIPFEEVREELHEQILDEKIQIAVARVFDEIRSKARVDNFLTNTSYGGVRQTASQQTAPGSRSSRPSRRSFSPTTR